MNFKENIERCASQYALLQNSSNPWWISKRILKVRIWPSYIRNVLLTLRISKRILKAQQYYGFQGISLYHHEFQREYWKCISLHLLLIVERGEFQREYWKIIIIAIKVMLFSLREFQREYWKLRILLFNIISSNMNFKENIESLTPESIHPYICFQEFQREYWKILRRRLERYAQR